MKYVKVLYGILFFVTVAAIAIWITVVFSSRDPVNAPQAAAYSAMAMTVMIGGYIGVRCIEKMVAGDAAAEVVELRKAVQWLLGRTNKGAGQA